MVYKGCSQRASLNPAGLTPVAAPARPTTAAVRGRNNCRAAQRNITEQQMPRTEGAWLGEAATGPRLTSAAGEDVPYIYIYIAFIFRNLVGGK